MRKAFSLAVLLGAAGSAALSAAALSAPTASKPPSISGAPAFDSVLICHKGTWSPSAISFDYSWLYAGGGLQFATGQKWRADAARLGYQVVCHVVAHDASGGTTAADSAPVLIGQGVSTIRITRMTQHHGTLTFTGVAGPSAALKSPYGKPAIVLDRRLNKTTRMQLAGPKVITSRKGKFTISGSDTPGHHTYIVEFLPASTSFWNVVDATRTLTLRP